MHRPGIYARRRGLVTLGVPLLAVMTVATACSATTQGGAPSTSPAVPESSREGDARTGPIRIAFEVDNYPTVQGQPIPTAADSLPGKAVVNLVEQFNATQPAGSRPVEALLVGASDLGDTWATNNPTCSTVLPEDSPVPDIFVPYQRQLAPDSLGCFLRAGTIVVIGQTAIVPTAWIDNTPEAFLLRGTTYAQWASAVSSALDDGTEPAPKHVVVMGAEEAYSMPQELIDAGYAEVVAGLQRPGREVTLFYSPSVSEDVASTDAAFALVPTKLRKLDVNALVLPGITNDPVPGEAMVQQEFTPPTIAAPDALLAADGYRLSSMRSLPMPTQDLDAESAAIRLRSELADTPAGLACLDVIEPDGRKVQAEMLIMLAMHCDVLSLVTQAVGTQEDALASPATFGAALTTLGSLPLADGTTAVFGAEPQLGAQDLVAGSGNDECSCFLPTDKQYRVAP